MWGADRKIRPRVTVWHHEGRIFLSAPNNHDRFFFLHTLWSPAFFNVGVKINESHSYMLTSAILKVDVICDIAMTSSPNVLTTELRDVLYNQCIDNTCCYSFFIYPMGWIRVCKIRFVSTGENRGKLCLVCKNIRIFNGCEVWIEHSITRVTFRRVMPTSYPRVMGSPKFQWGMQECDLPTWLHLMQVCWNDH